MRSIGKRDCPSMLRFVFFSLAKGAACQGFREMHTGGEGGGMSDAPPLNYYNGHSHIKKKVEGMNAQ